MIEPDATRHFDGAIVVANSANEARFIYPNGDIHTYTDAPNVVWHNTETGEIDELAQDAWVTPENVNVLYLGEADDSILDAASEDNYVLATITKL